MEKLKRSFFDSISPGKSFTSIGMLLKRPKISDTGFPSLSKPKLKLRVRNEHRNSSPVGPHLKLKRRKNGNSSVVRASKQLRAVVDTYSCMLPLYKVNLSTRWEKRRLTEKGEPCAQSTSTGNSEFKRRVAETKTLRSRNALPRLIHKLLNPKIKRTEALDSSSELKPESGKSLHKLLNPKIKRTEALNSSSELGPESGKFMGRNASCKPPLGDRYYLENLLTESMEDTFCLQLAKESFDSKDHERGNGNSELFCGIKTIRMYRLESR